MVCDNIKRFRVLVEKFRLQCVYIEKEKKLKEIVSHGKTYHCADDNNITKYFNIPDLYNSSSWATC